ncbi:MAG TPA: hypothetical protein VMW52_02595 [Phycisphaerae bacterium]|nr:hypothetical protein [Phycisphaerae bacterium]
MVDTGELDQMRVQAAVVTLCSAGSQELGEAQCRASGISDEVIAAAKSRIIGGAQFQRAAELGRSIVRLDDIYRRAIKADDPRTALLAEKTRVGLLGLTQAAAESGGADDGEQDAALDPTGDRVVLEKLQDVIRVQLEPLGLPGVNVHSDYVDLVILAAERIRRMETDRGETETEAETQPEADPGGAVAGDEAGRGA